MDQPYIFKKQIISLAICTILLILCTINHFPSKIILSYIFIILIITFLPYTRSKIPYPLWLHYLLYNMPFWIPLIFHRHGKLFAFSPILGIILLTICLLWTFYIIKIKKLHFLITSSERYEHIFNIFYYFYSLITEELYFRVFIISTLKEHSVNVVLIILFSSSIFVFTHYLNRWANVSFNLNIYLLQFILSIISSLFYYYGESVIYCIVLHFFFNIEDFINELYMLIHVSDSLFED